LTNYPIRDEPDAQGSMPITVCSILPAAWNSQARFRCALPTEKKKPELG